MATWLTCPIGLLTVAFVLLLPAGCPITDSETGPIAGGAALSETAVRAATITAGAYWVQERDGSLFYFDPGAVRGEPGRWVEIGDGDGSWYAGPGVYRFDRSAGWHAVDGAEGMVLDDLLQLHDPAPEVPAADP